MAKTSRFSKRNKTYRQDADIANLIERAAKLAGIPEADILDECVRRQLASVVKRRLLERALAKDKQAIATFARTIGKL